MLWAGIVVLVLAFLAALGGRLYPVGFGLGLGLLVAWYLFEREKPLPPTTSEDLVSLDDALHESSTEFDLPDLAPFLRRIVPHMSRGFGEREVARLSALAEGLRHNGECQTEFQVVFRGEATPLQVRLFKGDLHAIGVYFFTSQALQEFLEREMESFFEERGM